MTPICILCDKEMEWVSFVVEGEDGEPEEKTLEKSRQPYAGGEAIFIFSFGSTKFDNYFNNTKYRGFICDDCAEKYVDKMEESGDEK